MQDIWMEGHEQNSFHPFFPMLLHYFRMLKTEQGLHLLLLKQLVLLEIPLEQLLLMCSCSSSSLLLLLQLLLELEIVLN